MKSGRRCDITPICVDGVTMNQTNVGLILSSLRQNEGYNESEIGEKLGVTRTTIHHWEHGLYFPNLMFFISILDFFGYKLEVKKK